MTGAVAPFVVLALAAFLAYQAAKAWSQRAMASLRYRVTVQPARVFPGERIALTWEVENAKSLPLPWLASQDVLPEAIVPEGVRMLGHHLPRTHMMKQVWNLWFWQRVRRTYQATAWARGRYALGMAELRAADPFGWREALAEVSPSSTLLVYPRLFPLPARWFEAERPFGARARQGWLFHDPLQIVGVRPYQDGDPERLVHWAATARAGSLQVKQTSPAVATSVALFLEVRTFAQPWLGVDRPNHEAAVAVAASIAWHVLNRGGEVALHANGALVDTARLVRVRPGVGPKQAARVLEALAMVGTYSTVPLVGLLREQRHKLTPHVRFVVVTPLFTKELAAELAGIARNRQVDLVLVGCEAEGAAPPQVRVRHVSRDSVLAWWQEGVHA